MATKNLLVRIGVDLSGLKAGTKSAQKSLREMANVRKTSALNERSGLLKELSSAEAKVNKLETDYKRLVQDGGQSKQESAWMRQLKAAERELNALDKKWTDKNGTLLPNAPESVMQQYDVLGARIDEARARIRQIRTDPASTEDAKKLAEELENAKGRASELSERLDEVNRSVRRASAGQLFGSIADGAGAAAGAVGKGLTGGLRTMVAPVRSAAAHMKRLSSEALKVGWQVVKYRTMAGAFNLLTGGISTLITSNERLNASLAVIKGNLATAFAPVWNAVLPALQAAANAVATLTNSLANMMAGLFGVTISAAKNSAQQVAGAAGAAGSAMDKLKRKGADFDILHKVENTSASGGGGGASGSVGTDFSGVSEAEVPGWMKQVQSILKNTADGLKSLKQNFIDAWNMDGVGERITAAWAGIRDRILGMFVTMSEDFKQWCGELDFGPLLRSFAEMSEALQPVVDKVCGALEWGFRNVLLPFGKWAVEKVFPASLDLVSGALDVLDAVIELCRPAFRLLWDEFLHPIAEWAGEAFVEAVETVADVLHMLAALLRGDVEDFKYWASESYGHVKNFAETVSDAVLNLVGLAVKGFEQFRDGITESVQNTFTAIVAWLDQTLACVQQWAQSALDSIQSWANGALSSVQSWASQTMASISGWAQNCMTSVKDFANRSQQRIGEWVSSTMTSISGWVGSVVNQFRNFGSQAGNAVSGAVESIASAIEDLISRARNWGADFIGEFKDGIRGAVSGLMDMVRGVASGVASYLHFSVPDKGPLAKADTWMPDMIGLLSAGIEQNKGDLIGRVEKMTSKMALTMEEGGSGYRRAVLSSGYGSGPRRDNDDLIATLRSGFRQMVQAVNDKELTVSMDGSAMSRTVTNHQNRFTRMNGRPVVTG